MALKVCPNCGEKYSDTYKSCPFCAEESGEDEKFSTQRLFQKQHKVAHQGRRNEPTIVSPVLVFVMLILAALLLFLFFNDNLFSREAPAESSSMSSESSNSSSSAAASGMPESSGLDSVENREENNEITAAALQALPETLTLSKSDFTINVGDNPVNLSVSGGGSGYQWYSEDESIATVSEGGKVVAISAGTTNIIAYTDSGKGVCIVRVKGSGTPNTGSSISSGGENDDSGSGGAHSLNRDDMTLKTGESFQLKVSGTTTELSWSSSNNSIVSVADDGTVTGLAAGTVTVTVSWDGGSLSCIVRVKD